jgi:hypothetical protein
MGDTTAGFLLLVMVKQTPPQDLCAPCDCNAGAAPESGVVCTAKNVFEMMAHRFVVLQRIQTLVRHNGHTVEQSKGYTRIHSYSMANDYIF